MRIKRSWTTVFAVLTVAALFLSACGGKATEKKDTSNGAQTDKSQPKDGGTLTIGTFADIVTLNPLTASDTASGAIDWFLYANLYDVNAQGNIEVTERSIAAEMPKISADNKTYTVKLKSNAKWSDGNAITAEDVAFTINTMANEKAGLPSYSTYAQVKEAKAVDATTVNIELKDVDSRFTLALNFTPVPAKVFKDVKPEEINNNPFGKDPNTLITSGPYKWAEWKEKQYHKLVRDPKFWGKKANIETVIWKIYADQNTEVQALASGDVDFLETVPVAMLPVVQGKQGLRVVEAAGGAYDYIVYNFKGDNFPGGVSPFVGQKTRQAIGYAVNRKGMVDSVLQGHGTLLNGPFLPTSWANTAEAAFNFPYDKEKAKALLAEDGWKAGADGILVKGGQRFEFDVMTNAGNKRRESYAAIFQQNLKDVGIQVNIKPMEFGALIENHMNPGKFQTVLLGWSLGLDPDAESLFSSNFFPPAGQNYGFYKNEKTDKLWVDGYRTAKQDERKAVYANILKEFAQDPPYLFIAQQNIMTVAKEKVQWKEADKPVQSLPYGSLFHIFDWWVTE